MLHPRRTVLLGAGAALAARTGARAQAAFTGGAAGTVRTMGGMAFCWAPPGRFLMGSPRSEPERRPGEDQVEVTLTRGFWLGRFAVTQAEWSGLMGALPGELSAGSGPRFPVYNLSHDEALAFCAKLTGRLAGVLPAGWAARLPTEAQWEYACRAGTMTATSFGDRLSSTQANFRGEKPYNGAAPGPSLERTSPVGAYLANPWGLFDMHGNLFDWCADWYHQRLPGGANPDLSRAAATATRNGDGTYSRSRRGGCWSDEGWPCRSANRARFEPQRRADHIGMRVALTAG